ncbi:hypothetical protein L195_g062759, partial [Trifolium pratense]
MTIDAPEGDDRTTIPAVYAISKPEISLPSPDSNEEALMRHFNAHLNDSWENFPKAMVITSGGVSKNR